MTAKPQNTTAGKAYLNWLLNHLGEPVIATDENLLINYWNDEATKVFQKEFAEVAGRDVLDELQLIYCDTSEESVRNNILYKGAWKGELLYKPEQENLQAFELNVHGYKDEFEGYLFVLRNVTAQMHAEKELIGALHKTHQLHDMKNRFVCMASHEFRTPFSTILSSSNLIEKYQGEDEQQKRVKHTSRIKEAIHHMNAILEDFLSLTKLEEGKIAVHPYPLNLENLVTEIVGELEMIRKPGQQVLHRHDGPAEITADKKLLKMVIYNIVGNAIKFSGENKTIEIKSAVNDGEISVTVKDQGIGISPEDQEHVFKSFYRGKNALSVEGTGLGLHISKRYMEFMNGRLDLESELGKGTVARLVF